MPLVETDLLAGWLLHASGIEVPDGPLTAVRGELDVDGDPARVTDYRATRPKVERKLGHLMRRRHGERRAPGPRRRPRMALAT